MPRSSIPSFPIEIDVRQFVINANILRDSVFRMARQFGNMTEPLTKSVREVVTPSIIKNFASGGRPDWVPLSQSRIEQRLRSSNPSLRVLIDTEKLALAATSKFIWRISPTQADMDALDNIVPYAKFHQAGTKNMPQRQFALLQARDVDQIVDIFDKWIESMTNKRDFWPYFNRGF
jgi:phage gpG-like protein